MSACWISSRSWWGSNSSDLAILGGRNRENDQPRPDPRKLGLCGRDPLPEYVVCDFAAGDRLPPSGKNECWRPQRPAKADETAVSIPSPGKDLVRPPRSGEIVSPEILQAAGDVCPLRRPTSVYGSGLCPDAGCGPCGFGGEPQTGSVGASGASWRAVPMSGQRRCGPSIIFQDPL